MIGEMDNRCEITGDSFVPEIFHRQSWSGPDREIHRNICVGVRGFDDSRSADRPQNS
jgi:hypothetical protein